MSRLRLAGLLALLVGALAPEVRGGDDPPVRLHVLGRLYEQDVVSAFLLPGEPLIAEMTWRWRSLAP